MMEQDFVSMEEAERLAIEQAKKRIKEGEIKDIDIESTEIENMDDSTKVYVVKGHAIYWVKKGGIFSKQETAKKFFKAKIHAYQGKLISFSETD